MSIHNNKKACNHSTCFSYRHRQVTFSQQVLNCSRLNVNFQSTCPRNKMLEASLNIGGVHKRKTRAAKLVHP